MLVGREDVADARKQMSPRLSASIAVPRCRTTSSTRTTSCATRCLEGLSISPANKSLVPYRPPLTVARYGPPPSPSSVLLNFVQDLEATLFCLYAIEEAVPSDEPTHLSNLFGPILSHLPSAEFISLRSTTLRLVGSHSPWFVNQPEACMSAVSFVVAALGEQRLAPAAAKALRMLCDYNRKQLVGHVASFVTVLGGLVEGQVEVS